MQNKIENDGDKNDEFYIENVDIKVAIQELKAELSLARHDTNQKINDSNGIEETKANQITSGTTDEIIVLEHQEREPSMDC